MADAAAARREARRRRILENSENRLQLISGKCGEELPRDSPIRTAAISVSSRENLILTESCAYDKIPVNNGVLASEPELIDSLNFNRDIAAGDSEVPNDLASFTSQDLVQTSIWEKLSTNKYDIVLLSILIQLLYGMSWVTFDDSYLFLPVLIYIITKLIWFPAPVNSKFDSALQLINGMSSRRVQIIIFCTQCLSTISCDICIFLFITICIQSFLSTLNGLIT